MGKPYDRLYQRSAEHIEKDGPIAATKDMPEYSNVAIQTPLGAAKVVDFPVGLPWTDSETVPPADARLYRKSPGIKCA